MSTDLNQCISRFHSMKMEYPTSGNVQDLKKFEIKEEYQMSMHSRISKLDSKIKNKIVALLYANGCGKDDVSMLLSSGTLADIDGIIDLCEVFE